MTEKTYSLKEIGKVRIDGDNFLIELKEEYIPALKGLIDFSHIHILWWCHHNDTEELRKSVQCRSPYKKAPEILGTFATRSPFRPNPIGLTTARIKGIIENKGLIFFDYLDAENDSPVLDLKPFHPSLDRLEKFSLPKWCRHWPKSQESSACFNWEDEFNF